ncbi:PH domain-containing protein, partial [Klebsiella pneumoniae]|uniref:PH domain-containing protein n=1 Tax=Klebsiella pneumoniae TaxID=573 RepID=UPI001BE11E34
MGASFGAALFVSFLLMVPALLKHLRRNTTTYVLTESALEIAEGLLVRRRRTIPLRSIKQVTISQTMPELVFGLGTIEIENMGDG